MLFLDDLDDALASEWDELATRTGVTPFVRPGWILPWHAAFGRGRLLLAGLRRDDGRLAAALPLCRRPGGLYAPANSHTPVFGPVAEDGYAAAELALGLLRERPGTLSLRMLDGPSAETLETAIGEAGRALCRRPLTRSPHIVLDMGWEAYLRGFSRNRRKEMRRVGRRLSEQGEVEFEVHAGAERLDELLAEAFQVEGSGWKTGRGTAISSNPTTQAFYSTVARWAADRGWLRLCLLRVDGRAIAADLAVAHAGVWYALKGGYDVEWARYGPGIALLSHTVQHTFAEGFDRFELLGSPDPYKLVWANGFSERSWLAAFPLSARGRTAYLFTAARERARPVVRRALARRVEGRGRPPAQA